MGVYTVSLCHKLCVECVCTVMLCNFHVL